MNANKYNTATTKANTIDNNNISAAFELSKACCAQALPCYAHASTRAHTHTHTYIKSCVSVNNNVFHSIRWCLLLRAFARAHELIELIFQLLTSLHCCCICDLRAFVVSIVICEFMR